MRAAIAIAAAALIATACRRETTVTPAASSSVSVTTTTTSGSNGVSVITQSGAGNTTVITQPSVPIGEYKVASGGGQSITVGDIHIETSDDLPTRTEPAATEVTGNNQVVMVLRGWQIVLHEGRLLVAGRDFGPAPSGSRVRLAKDGVHVGDELRGPLP